MGSSEVCGIRFGLASSMYILQLTGGGGEEGEG